MGPRALRYSPSMEQIAADGLEQHIDIVHQHCLWLANSRTTTILQTKRNVPSVLAPHGSLEPWALQRSAWKKKIALPLYERSNLHNASCLHSLSDQEIAGFRDYGLKNPIANIQNGISQQWLDSKGDSISFRSKFNISPDKRILLYLSRITPIKGIPLLIEALSTIRKKLTDWVLVLAGADEFDHLKEIQAAVATHNLEKYVIYTGLLKDQLKRDAYDAADLFVLPTKREAAPVVVLEALGAGVPVLTTKGAPWEKLVTYQCGWWADIESGSIAEALKDAMNTSMDELKCMGLRGKELVKAQYTWTQSAQMTIELYEWLLKRREKPDFVVLD